MAQTTNDGEAHLGTLRMATEALQWRIAMQTKMSLRILALAILAAPISPALLWSQVPSPPQTIAVRAGKMFDPKSGTNLTNQVVIIQGDKITDVRVRRSACRFPPTRA